MSKVLCGLSVSVDGYITGRSAGPGRGLGDAGFLFDWRIHSYTAHSDKAARFDGRSVMPIERPTDQQRVVL